MTTVPRDTSSLLGEDDRIGKITRVPLREVWPHEAYDFTRWLEHNADVLTDVLDLRVENVEREQAAGSFSVDLIAESDAGPVVIENQLEKSDHDHLGKLITYLAAFEAKIAIWIVSDPRPEHVGAVTWLNESVGASFYLVKVEAIRIGDSPAAPLLTLITGPSIETKQVGAQKHELAERHELRHAFWELLLPRARERSSLFAAVSPSINTHVRAGSGRSGIHYAYSAREHDAGVHLLIETPDGAENQRIFEALQARSDEIQRLLGESLDWDRVENRKRCHISLAVADRGYRDPEEQWSEIQDRMIDAMVRLEAAFRPQLDAVFSSVR